MKSAKIRKNVTLIQDFEVIKVDGKGQQVFSAKCPTGKKVVGKELILVIAQK